MLTSGAAAFVAAVADWGSSQPVSSGAKAAITNAMQADLRNGCAGGLDFKTGPQVWIAVWWTANHGFARATEALLVAGYWDIAAAQCMRRRRNVTRVVIALIEKSFS